MYMYVAKYKQMFFEKTINHTITSKKNINHTHLSNKAHWYISSDTLVLINPLKCI